jgi:hypothetical protein
VLTPFQRAGEFTNKELVRCSPAGRRDTQPM